MKIGFFSPYLDSLSGGERYTLTLASAWSKMHDVSLFWDDVGILTKVEERLDIDLSRVRVVENIFSKRNILKKLQTTRQYDLIFFLTDGSIPMTLAKKNILHFQVPFSTVPYDPIKMSRFQYIVCNSVFTKEHIDPRVGKNSIVIYPPVTSIANKALPKEKIILSVGRFHRNKKQHVLIDAFAKNQSFLEGYTLVLVGGLQESDREYFNTLKESAKNLPISIYPNIAFEELTDWYNKASIYWHATGFEEAKPELTEHFGITTVEAMSVGCIPVVFNGGGLPEIVRDGENGYVWKTTDELIQKTAQAMRGNSVMVSQAVKTVNQFSAEKFLSAFEEVLKHL